MISSNKALLLLRIYFLLLDVSYSWNMTSLNLSDDVLIWRFAVWKNRAFLAIPRSANEKMEYKPTLVEVSWPEINSNWPVRFINTAIIPFSKNGLSKYNYRERTLVSVTGLDVDARGRLWILDAPDQYDRWPQIVIYDLKRNDRLISATELFDVSPKYLRALVIDPVGDQWGSRGYIADAGDETIIVYSLGNSAEKGVQNITVTWLGKKLGPSMGLICDLKDGLHYFMTSERASVRWDTKLPLNAQSYSVLMQSNDVPCITDYVMDTRRNIWGLVNLKCPGATKKNVSTSILKSRIVRILKYSFT
ncbi:hypothetical protein X777_05536 [Ooceraea biroi]|uniref:Uncharacterized protein n=1 Tax=Ooceraea biroi TaxID=2015173 RepID=A0A026WFW7_OOCBI|nr:hypothetical protein X777_05536 [Ooceraea biroi]